MSSKERYCNISVSRHTDPQREEEGAFMNNHTNFKTGTIFKRTLAMCVLLLLVLSFVGCESNQVELRDPNGEGTVDSATSTGVKTVSGYDRLPKLNVIYDGETYKAEPTTASWTALGEDGSGGFCVDGAHPLEFKNGFGLIKIKDGVSEIKLDFEIEPDKVFIRQWFEIYAGDISYADKYYSTPDYDKETKTIRISPNAGFVFEVTATWPEGTVYYGFWISDGKTEGKYAQENLGRDEEAVERFLETFPQEYVDIRDEGRAACASIVGFENSHLWEMFLAQVKGGKEACVVVATPTDEGDPILKYVHFDGADYWVVHDSHRDHFGTPAYLIDKFRYMSEFRTAGYDDYEVVLANEPLNSSEERTAYWDRIYAEYYEDEYKEPIDEDGYILAPFTLLYTRWK